MFFAHLLLWLSVSSPALADSEVEAADAVEITEQATVSYAVPAALVDMSILGFGTTLIVRESQGGYGTLRDDADLGLSLIAAGSLLGGAVSHTLFANYDVRWRSIGIRAKHLGLGTLYGLGTGLGLGLCTTGVCALSGGGYCEMALAYGLILGPVAGAVGGLGRGMYLDYKTLARREQAVSDPARLQVQPVIGVGPVGRLQLGLSGRF